MIPEAAVEEVAVRLFDTHEHAWSWEKSAETYRDEARELLEAAAPHMLSHERQQTADAHRDAIVNARTVDKLNKAVESVLALVRENDMNGVVIVNADRVRDAITKALQ